METIYYSNSERGNELTQGCIEYGLNIDSSAQ